MKLYKEQENEKAFIEMKTQSSLRGRMKYSINENNYPSFSLSVKLHKEQENEKALQYKCHNALGIYI